MSLRTLPQLLPPGVSGLSRDRRAAPERAAPRRLLLAAALLLPTEMTFVQKVRAEEDLPNKYIEELLQRTARSGSFERFGLAESFSGGEARGA